MTDETSLLDRRPASPETPAAPASASRTAAQAIAAAAPIDAEEAVFEALDAIWAGGRAPTLGVAVSGGGDSVALLHLAALWARARGVRLEAATVDHGLRQAAAAEAAQAAAAARALGLRAEILRWTDWNGRGNLQAEAREARRRLLGAWAGRRRLSAVALGHTMDDQAETVLLRLGRGAGVDGLSAIAPLIRGAGVDWARPLLGLRRADLRAWLRARGVAWVDDPSNEDGRFDRVRAREALGVLAGIGVTARGLASTAGHMRAAREALDHGAATLAKTAAVWGPCGDLRLALAPLRAAPQELARRLLRAGLTRVAGAEYGPRGEAENRLLIAMLGLRLGGGRSLHGCLVRPCGPGHAVVTREPAALPARAPASLDALWDGRFRLTLDARDGATAAPDRAVRIGPLGPEGAVALRARRERGEWMPPTAWTAAPRAARLSTPALWRGEALEAAPLAGFGAGLSARFAPDGGGSLWTGPAPSAASRRPDTGADAAG